MKTSCSATTCPPQPRPEDTRPLRRSSSWPLGWTRCSQLFIQVCSTTKKRVLGFNTILISVSARRGFWRSSAVLPRGHRRFQRSFPWCPHWSPNPRHGNQLYLVWWPLNFTSHSENTLWSQHSNNNLLFSSYSSWFFWDVISLSIISVVFDLAASCKVLETWTRKDSKVKWQHNSTPCTHMFNNVGIMILQEVCLKPGVSDWWIKGRFNWNRLISSVCLHLRKHVHEVSRIRRKNYELHGQVLVWSYPAVQQPAVLSHALRLLQRSSCSSGRQYLCFPSLVSPQEQSDVMKSLFPLRQLDCFAVSVKSSARIYISGDNQR